MQSSTQQEVIDSVEKGIRKAQRDYKKASQSLLCWGPEYLITTSIFQSLLRLPRMDNCLCLEEQAKEVEEYCKNRRPGPKPAVVDGRARCDLVLWHLSKDEPRALIEAKRWAADCPNDLKRLVRLVSQGLEFAIAASCLFEKVSNNRKDAEGKLRRRLNNLRWRAGQKVSEHGVGIRFAPKSPRVAPMSIKDEIGNRQKWLWCPVCVVIYHKKNQR